MTFNIHNTSQGSGLGSISGQSQLQSNKYYCKHFRFLNGKIILKWIFKQWEGWHGMDWSGSG